MTRLFHTRSIIHAGCLILVLAVLSSPAAAQGNQRPGADDAKPANPDVRPISVNDLPPRRIKFVQPVVPESAKEQALHGWVEVAFTVTANGDVEDATVKGAQPEGVFDEAALAAIRQWRFTPGTTNGQAVAKRSLIRLKF